MEREVVMNKPYQEISLLEFQTRYQTEEDCEKRLFKLRWPQGFACPSCGHQEYYHVTQRKLYQCKKCRHQTSLTDRCRRVPTPPTPPASVRRCRSWPRPAHRAANASR